MRKIVCNKVEPQSQALKQKWNHFRLPFRFLLCIICFFLYHVFFFYRKPPLHEVYYHLVVKFFYMDRLIDYLARYFLISLPKSISQNQYSIDAKVCFQILSPSLWFGIERVKELWQVQSGLLAIFWDVVYYRRKEYLYQITVFMFYLCLAQCSKGPWKLILDFA